MEHIKVELRIRPFTSKEKRTGKKEAWDYDYHTDKIQAMQSHLHNSPFTFDKIYSPECNNKNIYDNSCKDVVKKALEGIDTTIFVYGQTGSGKTHTMLGPPEEEFKFNGMIFSSLDDIYKRIDAKEEFEEFFLSCSYIEIYNEQIFDLLSKPEELKNPLTIFEDTSNKKFLVKGKTQVRIENIEEVFKILKYGETNRRYAETYFNHKSSRSHTIFSVSIRVTKIADNSESFVKESTINFVDLAGNERLLYEYKIRNQTPVKKRGRSASFSSKKDLKFNSEFYTPGERNNRLKESKHINKSLFFLTQVIHRTSRGQKGGHIPFRNSPLTKILRSSLGGHSRTLLILCISPTDYDFDITLSTLRFGKCAKKIENKVKPNIISSYNKAAIQAIVNSYEQKINAFNDKIKELENHQVDFMSFWQNLGQLKKKMIEKLLNFNKNLNDKNKLGFEEEIFTDVLIGNAGIIFNVKTEVGANFNARFENKNCLNCKFQKSLDDFNIKSIPVVFKQFKEKLEKESGLEELFVNTLDKIQENEKMKLETYDAFFNNLDKNFVDFFPFVKELINKIGSLRKELSFFEEPFFFDNLSDFEIEQNYNKIKKVYKAYQEERLTRKILKKLNKNQEDLENTIKQRKEEDFVIEELTEFEMFKKEIQEKFRESLQDFKKQNEEKEKQNNFFETAKKEMAEFIDKIYDSNYKIQNKLFQFHKNVKKRFHFFEKKFNWLYKKFQNKKNNNSKDFEKSGMKRNNSEGNISVHSTSALNKSIEVDKDKNVDDYFVYNMLNSKMQKLHQYKKGISELKDMHKNALNQDLSGFGVEKNMDDYNKNDIDKRPRVKSELSLPTKKKEIILSNENNYEKKRNQKKKNDLENKILEKQNQNHNRETFNNFEIEKKENLEDETLSNKEMRKSNSKFDISNFIEGDLDMAIDLNKFKINDSQNEIFDQNMTPINPLDLKQNSFMTEKDTLHDLSEKILRDSIVNPPDKKYEKFMISDKKNKKYESVRSDRFVKDVKDDDFRKKKKSLKKKPTGFNKFKKLKDEKGSYARAYKSKK